MAGAQPLVYLLVFNRKKERERETGYRDIEQQPQSRRTISIFIFILFCAAALVLPPFSFIEKLYRKAFSVFRQTFYAGRIGMKYATTATMTITDYYYDGCYVVQHKLRLPTTVTTCPTSHSCHDGKAIQRISNQIETRI